MKILFTSVGRRVELIQQFINAGESLNVPLTIYGCDCSLTAPALMFCNKTHQTPRISDSNYIPDLLSFCKEEDIDLVIPTIDTDLLLLSKHKGNFIEIGTKVLISDFDSIKICRDKTNSADFFNGLGLYTPSLFTNVSDYKLGFPAFIRPLDGSSSIDAYKVENKEQLDLFIQRIPNYIIAPFIKGKEYTVDCFCDFDGNPIFITPRIRLAVRSGEVLKTQIDYNQKIIEECKKIINGLKPCGPITIQLIQEEKTGNDYYIEINPRFGGGAPISMKAGADSAKAVLELLQGKRLFYDENAAKNGAIFSRFDQSVRIK